MANSRKNNYQSYPIYNFSSGLNLSREPWLIPEKAFSDILNFEIDQGVLRKRMGYDLFGEVVHWRTEIVATGDGSTTDFSGTLGNTPLRPQDNKTYFRFETASQGYKLYDEDMDGSLSGDGSGSVDYDTGDYSLSFTTAPDDSSDITCYYYHKAQNPVTGIYQHYSETGGSELLAMDTVRVNQWYPDPKEFRDLSETDEFTGTSEDYVQMETWIDESYITNNRDPIKKFDGTSLTNLDTDGIIDACSKIFHYKGHLIALRTTESGNIKPHRARWSASGASENWADGGYVDAPTLDWIISVSFLKDRFIVLFERSVWALNYIGDIDLPFQWEKLTGTEGSYARMSAVPFSSEILFLGPVDFLVFDGIDTTRLAKDIPEYALANFNMEQYHTTYGALLEERHLVFWNYPSSKSDAPDHNLVLNYWSNGWTIFDIPIQAVGYYKTTDLYTWDTIKLTWDEITYTWNAREIQPGYPIVLSGTQDGRIFILNRSIKDLNSDITARAVTKVLNPFLENMEAARLGYIDFYYTTTEDKEMILRIYEGEEPNSTLSTTIVLKARGGDTRAKSFVRVPINLIGRQHRIEIEHTGEGGHPRIHAIVPWMKPAGRIVEL